MKSESDDAPIDAFWVREAQLMAGEYPGDLYPDRAEAKVRWLVEQGISTFVDLTEAGELIPYEQLLISQSEKGQDVKHYRVPIRDLNVPSEAEMGRILDLIDEQIEAGRTVYVHCWGGIGRTGTVLGCHLARHGITGQAALDEIRRVRQGSRKAGRESPETGAQRAMILRWHEGA